MGPRIMPSTPRHLHAHIDAHQGEDGGQPRLVAHKLGLHHPAEQSDDAPDDHKLNGGRVVPGKQSDYRPGDHDGARTHNGDKIQHRQPQGQQQAVGLPDEQKSAQQDKEHAHGQEKLRLQVAAEGPQGGGADLAAEVQQVIPHVWAARERR